MCGICGIANSGSSHKIDRELLIRMRDIMIHRGPDDEGLHIDGNIGLGFRRLSIIDVEGGHQPMSNEDNSVWIVFNGEIYNHNELRKWLISRGHVYRCNCDTESIIHLYEEEGVDGLHRLNGMFAFAIWDSNRRRLILARDRLGIKPLYYRRQNDGLRFGSEIKSILEDRSVPRALNDSVLEEFLIFRYPAGDATMFRDIHALLPGHLLVWENGQTTLRPFWELEIPPARTEINQSDAVNQLDELLGDSVALRLMSDVPLGTLCSGGVDSSLTTALAVKQGKTDINTYSVGFHETEYDESSYANMVSSQYGTRHHELKVDNRLFADSLPKMIWHNDEPLNHANSIQIYHICKLARELVTVVVTGEGADELFTGYPRYLIPRLYRLTSWAPASMRKLSGAILKLAPERRLRKLADYLSMSLSDVMLYNAGFVNPSLANRLVLGNGSDMAYRRSLLPEESLSAEQSAAMLTRLELKTYLVSILGRMDKMSMATSIEGRVPFLDHRLVEWGQKIPEPLKISGRATKRIVKLLAQSYLPNEIIYRQKSGFGVPLGAWLRDKNGLGRYLDLLIEERYDQRGYIDATLVRRLVGEHLAASHDHSDILWELINLELWHRIYIEGADWKSLAPGD